MVVDVAADDTDVEAMSEDDMLGLKLPQEVAGLGRCVVRAQVPLVDC